MDLQKFFAQRQNLLLTAQDKRSIHQFVDMAHQPGSKIGVLSRHYPLLSGLTAAENVALPAMYHKGLSLGKALEWLMPLAQELGVDTILNRRPENLSTQDIYALYLLRAISGGNKAIAVISPKKRDVSESLRLLDKIKSPILFWILCNKKNRGKYTNFQLHEELLSPGFEGEK